MRRIAAAVLALALTAGACSDDDESGEPADDGTTTTPAEEVTTTTAAEVETTTTTEAEEPRPEVVPATLEGPITEGEISPPADPVAVDLAAIGYVQDEFFASGTATAYASAGPNGPDGMWEVEPASTAPYRTRFLVRRPADAGDFNGTVIVEWFNVSAIEAMPFWAYTNRAITDAGAAYVGISVQAIGVVGGDPLLQVEGGGSASGGLVGNNPERYGSLVHPGDAYSYDIYSQIAAALRVPGGTPVLGGFEPTVVIGAGESQSAGYLTTYLNAIHPVAGVFDGYFVHSRGTWVPSAEGVLRDGGTGVRFRTDLDVPVMAFQTETDVGPRLGYAEARQPDTGMIRVWEVAGTAHADAYLVGGAFPACPAGINNGPQHYVITAALEAFVRWVIDGTEPPESPRIETEAETSTTILRDERGLALGGIRTPSVDAPSGVLSGEAPADAIPICSLFGSYTPFDTATMTELYGDRDGYLAAFDASLDEAIEAGFVREADRERYAAEARAVPFG